MRWGLDARSFYRQAKEAYGGRKGYAIIALILWIVTWVTPALPLLAQQQVQYCQTHICQSDDSVVVAWMIIVPIMGMVYLNYRIVLKKELVRMRARGLMREMKNGMSGRMISIEDGQPVEY